MRHAQHLALPFQKKKLAVIISTMLACGSTNAVAQAPYLYEGVITQTIDTDDAAFVPLTAPSATCSGGASGCVLQVTKGADITFIGSNFQLSTDSARGSAVLLGTGTRGDAAAFLTIRGTAANKARITSINGNAVTANVARGRLTLDNVSISQTGSGGVGVSTSGVSQSLPVYVDIFNSDITHSAGIFASPFTLLTVTDTSITATNGTGILLSQTSELDGTRLSINSTGWGIRGTADGVGAAASFGYIRLTDSTIISGSYGIYLAPQQMGQVKDKLYLDKVSITTSGNNSNGIHSTYSKSTINNSIINTSGANARGIYAEATGSLDINNTKITTTGASAYGLQLHQVSAQLRNGSTLSTTGANAHLLIASTGASINAQDVRGTASGTNASALVLTVHNLTTSTTLPPTGNDYTNTATLENSILTSKLGKGIVISGGASSVINLTDTNVYAGSTLNAADRQSFVVDAQDVYNSNTLTYLGSYIAKNVNLTATSSFLDGNVILDRQSEVTLFDFNKSILRGNISLLNNSKFNTIDLKNESVWKGSAPVDASGAYIGNVNIDASSFWMLTGGDSVVGNVSNAGTMIFQAPAAGGNYQTLRIKGDYTGGGSLWMNGLLRSDNTDSKVDFLTIEGNVLGSTTQVHFLSTDALGTATTGQGIKVIEALGNASANAFEQANYVNAGAYRYSLVPGELNGAFDGAWYLTSEVSTNPPPPPQPPQPPEPGEPTIKPPLKDVVVQDYGNITMTAGVLPSLSNYLSRTALGTYQDRVAGSDNTQNEKGSWARSYNGSSNVRISTSRFETNGASHDRDIVGVQVGQDLYRDDTDARSRRFGVYVGASHVKSKVDDAVRGGNAGRVSLDGYNLGAYWTHQAPQGWYVDINAMATAYRNAKIRSNEPLSQNPSSLRTHGWGATTSVEIGYKQVFGDGWFVEPQGQLIYQHVSLKNANAGADMRVSFTDSSTLTSRVGTRVGKHLDKAENATLYTRMDFLHTMGANARTGYSNPQQIDATMTKLSSDMGGSWLQVGAGLNGALTKKTSLFGSIDYQYRVDGSGGNGVVGLLGVKHVW